MVVQDQVLGDGERADTAVLLAVLGNEPKAGINGLPRRQPGYWLAVQVDRSFHDRSHAEQRLGELCLAVALDAGDADDLPAEHLEVKILHGQRAVRAGHLRRPSSPVVALQWARPASCPRPA